MIKLRRLSSKTDLGCSRVYVRVDWNVPLTGGLGTGESVKIKRSIPLIRELRDRGAIVLVLTHLGRPKGREQKYSNKQLVPMVKGLSGIDLKYLDVNFDSLNGRKKFERDLDQFVPGNVVLLENVRFQKGEEKNLATLIRAYADHADLFINDAFASSHRQHASVTGLAKALPSFAGPGLLEEVKHLMPLISKAKKPYDAFIGGAKLSTKLPVIEALLKKADKVFLGGAMAHPFFVAKKIQIGTSLIEKESLDTAKKLAKNKKLHLPVDVIVAKKLTRGARARRSDLGDIKKTEVIGDIGTKTMEEWAREIRKAKTIVWNGSVGVAELPTFSHGSLLLGRAIASRARGKAYGVVGGGDTLPVVIKTGMKEHFDWISTGGGAMLEFISTSGKLPGLTALQGKGKRLKLTRKKEAEKNCC